MRNDQTQASPQLTEEQRIEKYKKQIEDFTTIIEDIAKDFGMDVFACVSSKEHFIPKVFNNYRCGISGPVTGVLLREIENSYMGMERLGIRVTHLCTQVENLLIRLRGIPSGNTMEAHALSESDLISALASNIEQHLYPLEGRTVSDAADYMHGVLSYLRELRPIQSNQPLPVDDRTFYGSDYGHGSYSSRYNITAGTVPLAATSSRFLVSSTFIPVPEDAQQPITLQGDPIEQAQVDIPTDPTTTNNDNPSS